MGRDQGHKMASVGDYRVDEQLVTGAVDQLEWKQKHHQDGGDAKELLQGL